MLYFLQASKMKLITKFYLPQDMLHFQNNAKFKGELPIFKHQLRIIEKCWKNMMHPNSFVDLWQIQLTQKKQSTNISVLEKNGFQGDSQEKCLILYGFEYNQQEWKTMISSNCLSDQIVSVCCTRSQGKSSEKEYILKNVKTKEKELIKCNSHDQEAEMNNILGQIQDEDNYKFSPINKVVVEIKGQTNSIFHIYYLPSIKEEQISSDIIKTEYFTTKFLQILQQYVSLDSKTNTLYKDSAHTQFQNLLYSGKVSSFSFYVDMKVAMTSQMQAHKAIAFLSKLSELSLTDKHLLQEIDSLSLIQFKKELRKLCVEESRLRKSLSVQKNQLTKEIYYLIELLDLKENYPEKVKFNEIDIRMLKKIRAQNVEKRTNWIKDQSFVCRNLEIRLADLVKIREKYLKQEIEEKIKQSKQIEQIRNQIRTLEMSLKQEQEKRDKNLLKNENLKNNFAIKKRKNGHNFHLQNEENLHSHRLKCDITGEQIIKECDKLNSERSLQIQMLKAEFQFEREFQRRKKQYAKASQELIHYLTDC